MIGNNYQSERRQLCEGVRALRRRMDVSQQQFARLVGVDPRTIWNWEARVYAPTLSKRFRLGQLMRFVEEIDMRDRTRPVEFANEPGRYNRPGRPQPRRRVVYQVG